MWKWVAAGAGVVVLGAGAFFLMHGQEDRDQDADMAIVKLGDLEIIDTYVVTNKGTADTAALYFTLENDGDTADRLVVAKSDVARAVELHTHIDGNGVMKMRPVDDGFEIPANGERRLQRGGDHVMLMGLNQSLKDGDTFELTLEFQNAGDVSYMVKVGDADHEGHNH